MGKSNLGILTDEIIVVTQPESAGDKSKNMDHDTYPQQNHVLFTQDYTVFILKDTGKLRHEFHKFKTC